MRAGGGLSDRVPMLLKDDIIDGKRKFFHTKDEEVRRQQITLSKTMCVFERRKFVFVPKHRKS